MYTAFENYARRVVTHLGDGWTVARHGTWTDCLIASHTDGRALELWSQNGGARLGANGHFPSTEYGFLVGDRPETYAAITRPAQAVARQIASRVLPGYTATLAKVLAHNERAARLAAERTRLHGALMAYVPDKEMVPGSLKRPVIEHTHVRDFVDGGFVDTDRFATSIAFRDLDEATATVIMQAYATARAAQDVV
jgi:hypothetical protein